MKKRALREKQAGFQSAGMGIILVALSLMTAGCMQSYGKLKSNPVIFDRYQADTLSETYQYYFSGRPNLPDAVVGIDTDYHLQGRLWFKIDTRGQVYERIRNLSDLHPDATSMRTADILDHQGNKIGEWFSYFFYTPVRIDPENKMVEILDPRISTGGYGRSGP